MQSNPENGLLCTVNGVHSGAAAIPIAIIMNEFEWTDNEMACQSAGLNVSSGETANSSANGQMQE